MSSTDSPVEVGEADDVYIFRVSPMKKLFFRHTVSTVVLHLILLPLDGKKIHQKTSMKLKNSLYEHKWQFQDND